MQPPSKNVVKSSPDTRGEVEHVLADLDVVKEADVEVIVECSKRTSTLKSQIMKAVSLLSKMN